MARYPPMAECPVCGELYARGCRSWRGFLRCSGPPEGMRWVSRPSAAEQGVLVAEWVSEIEDAEWQDPVVQLELDDEHEAS
jgi:hypothetical protein